MARASLNSTLLMSLVLTTALTTQVQARGEYYEPVGSVTAKSEFGNGTVRGAVRRGRLGLQVRLPGGSWIHCARSCKESLRLATVDFFESERGRGPDGAITQEPGIFGKLRLDWGW